MNTKETLNKVRTLLGIQVKFEQMKLENGAILEAEVFEAGAEIFVVADEERVAVPVGEYETEDSMVIVVLEEGIIAEVKAVENEEAPAEVVNEVVEEELATEVATPKKVVKSISEETFFSEIKRLEDIINSLKEPKVELSQDVKKVELSADQEVEGITHTPEATSAKKEMHLYAQKGKNTILNKIYSQINK
jgi:hypothetical protein